MKESRYDLWKLQPFTRDQTPEIFINKIDQVIEMLNIFYGLTGASQSEIKFIYEYCLHFFKKFQKFKLVDMDRAFELYKKHPELNKITPAYFEYCFETYLKSQERKEIMMQHDNETKDRLPEKSERTKEERFNECFEYWKQTGNIRLNSGLVYTETFQDLVSNFGLDKLYDIQEFVRQKLIDELKEKISLTQDKDERRELNEQFNQIQSGGALLKVETRKAHLRKYFEQLNNLKTTA